MQRSGAALGSLAHRTRSIRAAKALLARLLHRQSVGALTGRAAFPSHGVRSRNRPPGALEAAGPRVLQCARSSEPEVERALPCAARHAASAAAAVLAGELR